MTASVPLLALNDGHLIPQLGLGIYGPGDAETASVVSTALGLGYRLIDTAALYENERGVGDGIRDSGIPREEIYVTTKLADDRHGYDETRRAFDESLGRLGLEYVDLYLIHWPLPGLDLYPETWRALERIRNDGLATSIGVSNFQVAHLDRLSKESDVVPAVNQVEMHPGFPNTGILADDAARGIHTQAWSPLGRGRVFDKEVLQDIAARHDRSVAQVVLRWLVEAGAGVIPKSVTPARLVENMEIFDFTLDDSDRALIATVADGVRTGANPDEYNG